MDKKKIAAEIAMKLKTEMSVTGTGASVTPGTGEGVATKYAFGKSNNKGTPKDWKAAPSTPNRPSKAIDYKELWEDNSTENESEFKVGDFVSVPTSQITKGEIIHIDKDGKYIVKRIEGMGPKVNTSVSSKNSLKSFLKEGEPKKISLDDYLTKLGFTEDQIKNIKAAYSDRSKGEHSIRIQVAKLVGADKAKQIQKWYQNDGYLNEIDVTNTNTDEILTYIQAAKQQGKLTADAQNVLIQWINSPGASREEIIKVLRKLTGVYLNEGYARFRNESKTRTKPEQFHTAVKQVKQKVNEINRLFEYMGRLQNELMESEGGLKHKKYTDKAIQQIKESTKSLFFKSTKLK